MAKDDDIHADKTKTKSKTKTKEIKLRRATTNGHTQKKNIHTAREQYTHKYVLYDDESNAYYYIISRKITPTRNTQQIECDIQATQRTHTHSR